MRLNAILCSFWIVCLAGCATVPPAKPVALRVQADGLVTHRGVLTIHGRQFPINGYLATSQTGGLRLVMTASFGQVLADVLVKSDGSVYLMRPSALLRRQWIEEYVVHDLKKLFGTDASAGGSYTISNRSYTLELQTVGTKPGPQPDSLFDESKAVAK